ncbi:MAG: glycoside hydrolase family 32 protein [Spirochaetia bacterium]
MSLQKIPRPSVHFSIPENWMNDPNGLIFYRGQYHLFFQYNPKNIIWGPMHWGHAVSENLKDWEMLPLALAPDDNGMVFSGSAVYDRNNTTGLFSDAGLAVLYTSARFLSPIEGILGNKENIQTQSLAYSENGKVWTKYKNNPVIPNPGTKDFRDPKVFQNRETGLWNMVVSGGTEVLFYESGNLIDWNFLSSFSWPDNPDPPIFECPDLICFETPEGKRWALIVGVMKGNPNTGSGVVCFIGKYGNGVFSVTDDGGVSFFDHGGEFYAAQTWSNLPDDRKLLIGWMANLEYAESVPADTWRGVMSMPRELELRKREGKYRIYQYPSSDVVSTGEQGFQKDLYLDDKETGKSVSLPDGPFRIDVQFRKQGGRQLLRLVSSTSEMVSLVYEPKKNTLTINRSASGVVRHLPTESLHQSVKLSEEKRVDVSVFLDLPCMEVFCNNGEAVFSNLVFPGKPYSAAVISMEEGANIPVTISIRKIG